MSARHVTIAHHSKLFGRGLRQLLEDHGFHVVGVATNSTDAMSLIEAFEEIADHPAGVVLLDEDLDQDGRGQAIVRMIARDHHQSTMVLNSSWSVERVAAALEAGAVAVLDGACGADHLFAAIEVVGGGGMVFSGHVTEALAEDLRDAFALMSRRQARALDLTARETEILQLLPTPLTLGQIAARLYVSRKTIQNNASCLYRKLGAEGRAGTVARAMELGLLSQTPGDGSRR